MSKKEKIREILSIEKRRSRIIVQRYVDNEPEPQPPDIAPEENIIFIVRHIITNPLNINLL